MNRMIATRTTATPVAVLDETGFIGCTAPFWRPDFEGIRTAPAIARLDLDTVGSMCCLLRCISMNCSIHEKLNRLQAKYVISPPLPPQQSTPNCRFGSHEKESRRHSTKGAGSKSEGIFQGTAGVTESVLSRAVFCGGAYKPPDG